MTCKEFRPTRRERWRCLDTERTYA
jgi:hypothetical protein